MDPIQDAHIRTRLYCIAEEFLKLLATCDTSWEYVTLESAKRDIASFINVLDLEDGTFDHDAFNKTLGDLKIAIELAEAVDP